MMPKIIFSAILLLIITACNNSSKNKATLNENASADATYYFIRHADKVRGPNAGENPALNETGKARADFWAEQFKDIDFDAVYSTDFTRTRNTALPTAKKNNLSVQIYEPSTTFYSNFKNENSGKTVLIVGHSNTTPAFVNAILGTQKYSEINDAIYGNLYIVRIINGVAEVELKDLNNWNNQ
tara:strand:+ start:459 stop:1007 length:549 start_codon:yes stop_codon:yes gene_type:complete